MLTFGCAGGIEVESHWTPDRKLGAVGSTYTWAPTGDWVAENPDLDRELRDLIDGTLAAKGYRKQPRGDYQVRYRIRKYVEQAQVGHDSWEEGALAVDILDGPSGSLIWYGAARARIDFSLPPEKARKRIDAAVKRVLNGFPDAGK
jgi:hypothetical protein